MCVCVCGGGGGGGAEGKSKFPIGGALRGSEATEREKIGEVGIPPCSAKNVLTLDPQKNKK